MGMSMSDDWLIEEIGAKDSTKAEQPSVRCAEEEDGRKMKGTNRVA